MLCVALRVISRLITLDDQLDWRTTNIVLCDIHKERTALLNY